MKVVLPAPDSPSVSSATNYRGRQGTRQNAIESCGQDASGYTGAQALTNNHDGEVGAFLTGNFVALPVVSSYISPLLHARRNGRWLILSMD